MAPDGQAAPPGIAGGGELGTAIAAEPPPRRGAGQGIGTIFRDNLFKDAKNSILTLIFGGVILFVLFKTFNYVFITARWEVIYNGPLEFYMVGKDFGRTGISFEMLWAGIYTAVLAMGIGSGLGYDPEAPPMRRGARMAMIGGPLVGIVFILSMTRTITPTLVTLGVAVAMVVGNRIGRRLPQPIRRRSGWILLAMTALAFGLITDFTPSNIDDFGGLLLTIVVAFAGIALSFPIGVIMALARRSTFPLIRPLAVGYIELVRGVPLISLLFMGQFAIGFLFPPDANIPGPIFRAIIMITLFSGAYVAEVVRGGLQSVPAGQIEAGKALGLSPFTITRQIVLPQALRNSIPALIGQFISLLKDVSLLVIIGLQEMLGVVDVVLARREFVNQGYVPEAYAFVGTIYWTLCFSMSRAAQRLETRLGVGTR
ncbi:MAG: amino acid ABC transporter permease [Acidimicrobiales bacterium]|jgi:general L-amino acid transport system permease protein|nr:amino acid ABC transporter permease [Acidimicrobiales bacterium]